MTRADDSRAELFASEFEEQFAVAKSSRELAEAQFNLVLDAWIKCIKDGGKILFFGNGGSATQAQHLSTELVVRYRTDRPAISAVALTTDTGVLTAGANDFGYEQVFARQIEALGRNGDLACAFSTSGSSPSVNIGLRRAREQGLAVTGMTGGDGGEMAKIVDALIIVPSRSTARIQEMHLLFGHMLCLGLERELKYS
jgi:D-sedoheptulose 7-phosphate isomerase